MIALFMIPCILWYIYIFIYEDDPTLKAIAGAIVVTTSIALTTALLAIEFIPGAFLVIAAILAIIGATRAWINFWNA